MCLWNDLGKIPRSWNLRCKLPGQRDRELSARPPPWDLVLGWESAYTAHRLLRPALEWP